VKAEEPALRALCANSESRLQMWIEFLRATQVEAMAEIGVYRGHFAAEVLASCSSIQRYYLIDPWRHLDGWNKPANTDDAQFAAYLSETKAKTEFAGDRRIFLRGTTGEVLDQIPDASLDFAYIDGDHTLHGISIDLIKVYPKVRRGGWIGGDDFTRTVWQHQADFEPTLVFPFAVYFAEAVGARIYGLPHQQFLISKPAETGTGFEFVDLTGDYPDTTLQSQFRPQRVRRRWVIAAFSPGIVAERLRGAKNAIKKARLPQRTRRNVP
jgi:hypothetical protein